MRRQNVLICGALALLLGSCLEKDPETESETVERQIRCSFGRSATRGYAELVYIKYAGLCVGRGKHNGEHAVQENVACRIYEEPDAGGLIKVINGTVDGTTRDCRFTVDETGELLISRNDDGDVLATSTDPRWAGPLSCVDETVTLAADAGCTEGILPRATYDTGAEAAANGVQAVCEGKNRCVEYSGFQPADLEKQQGLCADTWRPGACSTATPELKSGCEKKEESGGRRLVWEKTAARESCED